MQTYYNRCQIMFTRFEAVFPGLDEATGERVFEAMRRRLEEEEKLLSAHDAQAEVYALNKLTVNTPATVSPELWTVLNLGKELHERSLGYFDIGVFRKVQSEKSGETTGESVLGIRYLEMEPETNEVLFTQPIAIDTGGFGKGYGLRSAIPVLDQYHIRQAFISFGGSSILTRGRHPHGDHWPFRLANSEIAFQLKNHCVSTSETVSRRDGQERFHLFNPRTGKMIRRKLLAAVQHQDPVEAEVLSTAILLAAEEEYEQLIENFRPERVVLMEKENILWEYNK